VGLLWSYANTFETVKKNYCLKDFVFIKEPLETILDSIVDPDVVAVSCYVWNMNFSMQLAKMIKERYPSCVIIAGGPNVTVNDNDFFQTYPFLDILSYREGEISFKNILLSLAGEMSLDDIGGIGYNKEGRVVRTIAPVRIENLDQIPSPYLAGYFDNLIERCRQRGITYNALIETNRGCPFQCTFCDWGNGALGKVKKFDLRRVKKELLWMARAGVDYVDNCDANFGAFKDRDLAITKFIIKLKQRYGFPRIFNNNWHKNNNQSTVELAKLQMDAGLLRRFTSSIQSLNDDVLRVIKRKNLSDSNIQQIVNFARTQGVKTQTELIIALPEETYRSFQDAYVHVIESGMIPSAVPLTLLPNSEMSQADYRSTYGLKTKFFKKTYTYVDETEELVIGTNTMTVAEFERLTLWVWVVQQLHYHGYTNLIYDYFHRSQGWNMAEFYERLLTRMLESRDLEPNHILEPYKNHVEDGLSNQLTIGSINHQMHDRISNWHRSEFYSGLKELIRDMGVTDSTLLNDLIGLQNLNQVALGREQAEVVTCSTNLYDYIYNNQSLQYRSIDYLIEQPYFDLSKFGNLGTYITQTKFSQAWKCKISRCADQLESVFELQ
jgi:putative methyltransferase